MIHQCSKYLMILLVTILANVWAAPAAAEIPIRIGIAGLTHGHVEGFLWDVTNRGGFEIVGITETNGDAIDRYFNKFNLRRELLSSQLDSMISKGKPDFIVAFGATTEHLPVVRAALAKRIPVMMEKPLAANQTDASEIEQMSRASDVPVIVNYETSWYPSTHFLFSNRGVGGLGSIKKVVVRTGHRGPLEIGVHPEFLAWLTDPARGGGAMLDFGCYGVQLLLRLFQGVPPLAVTAVTQKFKSHPAYARVEDEATLIVEFPGAQGIVQASWNWPTDRKDWDVHGERGSLSSRGRDVFIKTEPDGRTWSDTAPPLAGSDRDPLSYIAFILGRGPKASPLTVDLASSALNSQASRVLDAAARSARERRTITL